MFKNINYYMRESALLFKVDAKSNRVSVLSISFILFIAGLFFAVGFAGKNLLKVLQEEADIAVFYSEETEQNIVRRLEEDLKLIEGVLSVESISRESAMKEMEEVLGKDKEVLALFDENPFAPYLRVKVDLVRRETILKELSTWAAIDHIRDNREVVEKIEQIIRILTVLGIFMLSTVVFVSILVISHIIRQGVFLNREQIQTLHLLGAPKSFIRMPFLLEGMLMSFLSGILAVLLLSVAVYLFYTRLGGFGFFPLPEMKRLLLSGAAFTIILSLFLGIFGSISGVKTIRGE